MRFTIELTGTSPLLSHNPVLADPSYVTSCEMSMLVVTRGGPMWFGRARHGTAGQGNRQGRPSP